MTSSALTVLIPKDILGNDQIEPTDPDGVTLHTAEDGVATFVKHTPSGRVGIIPHIVPEKPLPGCTGAVGEGLGRRLPSGVTVTLMGAKFLTSGTVYATAVADFHSSVQAVSISVATVEEVIPPLDAGGIEMTFTINCPYSSAASMGAALVPENLFPVDKEAHRRLLAGRLRAAARGVCDAPQSRWKQRASRSNIRTGTVFRLSL